MFPRLDKVMALFELFAFVAALALVGVYFSESKDSGRRYAFLALCALGLILIAVGFAGAFFTGESAFSFLGHRVSLLVFSILTFGTLLHEKTFTKVQLRKYFYPAVCWWFVAWTLAEAIIWSRLFVTIWCSLCGTSDSRHFKSQL